MNAATITTGATDTSANPLAVPYSWNFTTSPALLTTLTLSLTVTGAGSVNSIYIGRNMANWNSPINPIAKLATCFLKLLSFCSLPLLSI